MENLRKINNLISYFQASNSIEIETTPFFYHDIKAKSIQYLNMSSWFYNFYKNSFELISNNLNSELSNIYSFSAFYNSIYKSFKDYYIKYCHAFFSHCINNFKNSNTQTISLKALIPLKTNSGTYTFYLIDMIPYFSNEKLLGFYFLAFPIKKYNKEYIEIGVYQKFMKNENLSEKLKTIIPPPEILTPKQKTVFWQVLMGHSTSYIADALNLKPETVYKMNIRITERLNDFFEMKFENISSAAEFYKKCFLTNN